MLEKEQAHAELARAWRLVALIKQIAGALGPAGDAILKVVTHARAAGDERLVARSALGLTFNAVYGPTPVQQALEQCEEFVSGELRDRQVQGLIMCKLAQLRAMNGDFESARSMYHQARSMLNDLGHSVRAAQSSCDLATIELLAGDPAAAERELRVDYETLVQMGATYFLSSMAGHPGARRPGPGPRRGSARAHPRGRSGGRRRRRRSPGAVALHPCADPGPRRRHVRGRSPCPRRARTERGRPRCRACTRSRSPSWVPCCIRRSVSTRRGGAAARRSRSTRPRATSCRRRASQELLAATEARALK